MELISKGIPADIAQFFAAARMETRSPDDKTCIYLQTFPNGASREMTLRVSPDCQYTPTPDEITHTTSSSTPIYAFNYSSNVQTDGTTKIEMNYYVPKAAISEGVEPLHIASGKGSTEVVGISWDEVWKKGVDWSIGTFIDYAKEAGIKVESLGSIFALASALSDVTGALDLSKQNSAWLDELDAFQKCAANPTNPFTMTDPGYSVAAVAKVQAARNELKEVNAVRYINIMTETGAGITPVTAVLSVGMKPAFLWNEKVLNDFSENTIMREVRLFVVPCTHYPPLTGNVAVLWDCTSLPGPQIQTDYEVCHIVANVSWVLDPRYPNISTIVYSSQGSFTYENTFTSTVPGHPAYIVKKTAIGNIEASGYLMIINDPVGQNVLGYSYCAGGGLRTQVNVIAISSEGTRSGVATEEIEWLPYVQGYQGTGGSYEGEMTKPSCFGSSTGTFKVKWAFSAPPAK